MAGRDALPGLVDAHAATMQSVRDAMTGRQDLRALQTALRAHGASDDEALKGIAGNFHRMGRLKKDRLDDPKRIRNRFRSQIKREMGIRVADRWKYPEHWEQSYWGSYGKTVRAAYLVAKEDEEEAVGETPAKGGSSCRSNSR